MILFDTTRNIEVSNRVESVKDPSNGHKQKKKFIAEELHPQKGLLKLKENGVHCLPKNNNELVPSFCY